MRYIFILVLLAGCASLEEKGRQPPVERSGPAAFPQAEVEDIARKSPPPDPARPAPKVQYRQNGVLVGEPVFTTPDAKERPVIWAYLNGRSKHEGWRWWMKIDYAGWVTNGADPTDPKIAVPEMTIELLATPCYPAKSETAKVNITELSAFYEITTEGVPAWSCTPDKSCSRTCVLYKGMNICTQPACGAWN